MLLRTSTAIVAIAIIAGAAIADGIDIPATAAHRQALLEQKPFEGICPRVKPPNEPLTVLRFYPREPQWRITLGALQGIVNRPRPRLYLGADTPLRWFEYYWGGQPIEIIETREQVLSELGDAARGLVIYDPKLDATGNIAITMAGLDDLLPVTPQQAEQLTEEYDWPVVEDLRGRWEDRVEAYTWALEQLMPRCNHWALMHFNNGHNPAQDDDQGFCVDYAVQHRMFNWHLARHPVEGEMELTERVFTSVAFHSMIFGGSHFCDMYAEPLFVSLVSRYGNLHSHSSVGNMSVLSSVTLDPGRFRQEHPEPPTLDPEKIYLCFMMSEEDNLGHLLGWPDPFKPTFHTHDPYRIWWMDPRRGHVPIGWAFGPLGIELAPTTMAHYYETATPADGFMCGLGGICLGTPAEYGVAYPDLKDQLQDRYAQLTGEYMNKLDMQVLNTSGDRPTFRRFIEQVPELTGIFVGYGKQRGYDYERSQYLLDGVPIFHDMIQSITGTARSRALAEENARKARELAERIRRLRVPTRPAFLYIWCVGWDWGPTTLEMTMDNLGDEYVPLRPGPFVDLYRNWRGEQQAAKPEIVYEPVSYQWPEGARRRLPIQVHCDAGFNETVLLQLDLSGRPAIAYAATRGDLRVIQYDAEGNPIGERAWQLLPGAEGTTLAWTPRATDDTRVHFCLYPGLEPTAAQRKLQVRDDPHGTAIVDTGPMGVKLATAGDDIPPIVSVRGPDGEWRGRGNGITYSPRDKKLQEISCRADVGPIVGDYSYAYDFGTGGTRRTTVRAIAGAPYILLTDRGDELDLPSWSLDLYPGLEPDTVITNTERIPLHYRGSNSHSGLPSFRWSVLTRGDNEVRDAIGLLSIGENDWRGSSVVLWSREAPAVYFEFYHSNPNWKKAALVAISNAEPERLRTLWRQLNAGLRFLTGNMQTQ